MTEQRTHAEAPASATAKMMSPGGVQWLITLRDDTANGLLDKINQLEPYLLKHGWTPDGGARSANGNGGGDAPRCPVHDKPMKKSKHGNGYFCPVKVADYGGGADGSRPIYCKAKTE